MMRSRSDAVVGFVLLTVALAIAAASLPGDRKLAVSVYVIGMGTLLMWAIVSELGAAAPRRGRSELKRALDAPARTQSDVAELARMKRIVTLGVGSAADFHTRLLPLLRDIAWTKLERQGRRPGPDTLGEWWELLRPDAPPPEDRFARGIGETRLRALVHDLERM